MKNLQDKISKFNEERDWNDQGQLKDLLLNVNEEIGELWNIIKWVDTDTQKKLIKENEEEVENFIGDVAFLILKIAYLCDVDAEKATNDVLEEYLERFPLEKTKGNHANKLAGGIDLKKETD